MIRFKLQIFKGIFKILTAFTVHLALKLAVTLGASATMSENSFLVLKNIMQDRRQSKKHGGKKSFCRNCL